MKKNLFTFYFLLLTSYLSLAQSVPEPIYKDVYSFLDRLANKGVIELNDVFKSLSRNYIAEKLNEVRSELNKDEWNNGMIDKLSSLELDELEFWENDFGLELKRINLPSGEVNSTKQVISNQPINNPTVDTLNNTYDLRPRETNSLNWFGHDKYSRLRAISFESDLFSVNVSPIFGYRAGKIDSTSYSHFWNGLSFYGYLTDHIGFSFSFRDNRENWDLADRTKQFTPETGIVRSQSDAEGFEYSEVRTTIGTSWDWGSFYFGKDFITWGYEKGGEIVLSDKAPSFPFFRLDISPASWLHFNYMHAWMSSGVFDSTQFYASLRNGVNRRVFRDKYLASHTLTIVPSRGLSISLGESIIYSDRLRFEYLQPLMFFRLADHYLSRNNNDAGDNSQFFFSVSSRNHIPNTHLYSTLYIDEIIPSEVFSSEKQRNQLAFSIGASVVDLPVPNLQLTIEYTRTNPFVYRHYIPTQTYESNGYILGHWMGHNADQIYASLEYRIIRGLKTELWFRSIRKGGDGEVEMQYTRPSQEFLFGLDTKHTWWGFNLKYEIFHDMFAELDYQSRKSSKEQLDGSFIGTKTTEFTAALYYGL